MSDKGIMSQEIKRALRETNIAIENLRNLYADEDPEKEIGRTTAQELLEDYIRCNYQAFTKEATWEGCAIAIIKHQAKDLARTNMLIDELRAELGKRAINKMPEASHELLRVVVDKKWTVIQNRDGTTHCERRGELSAVPLDNLHMALAWALADARDKAGDDHA